MMMVSICSFMHFSMTFPPLTSPYCRGCGGSGEDILQHHRGCGMVEVCAIVYMPIITCPVAFSFDVSLSTDDASAGTVMKLYL